MPEGERRLAAIMFTDLVGFTLLSQRNESLALSVLNEQRELLHPIFNKHGGREVKTIGDAFLVDFASALQAVKCAYDIQKTTREFNNSLPEERRVHLRIGVHLGDIVESQGDISGDAVNVASRIESVADSGGVCLTRQVYDQVENKFELPLRSLGAKSLKNLRAPMEVFKMVMPWEEAMMEETVELDSHRVAVLPLKNMSPDPNDEYFADGMTEEPDNHSLRRPRPDRYRKNFRHAIQDFSQKGCRSGKRTQDGNGNRGQREESREQDPDNSPDDRRSHRGTSLGAEL